MTLVQEFRKTWFGKRGANPIDVWFGPVQQFDDLRTKGERLAVQMEIANRVMDGIRELAATHKQEMHGEE